MVYDAVDGYEVYFGGESNGSFFPSTWIFSNGAWSNVTASAGTPPSPRTGMGMTYDVADGYVLAVGGDSNSVGCGGPSSANCNDTWTFSQGKWTELSPTFLPICLRVDSQPHCTQFPGGSNPIAYDAAEGGVVLFAGDANSPGFATETWTYLANVWTQINTTAAAPPLNQGENLAYDNATEEAILFGGTLPGEGGWVSYNATWAFADGTWTNLSSRYPQPPAARSSFGFTYDSASSSLVLFGGFWARCVEFGTNQACLKGVGGLENDTWTFTASGWSNVTSAREPLARWNLAFADDPDLGGPLLFGGSYNGSTVRADLGDTWNWSATTRTWTPINIPQALAPPRITASPNPAVFGEPVEFDSNESGGATPYTYSWSFGDGGTGGNLPNITHAYTTNGPFLVVLTVSDAIGQAARGYLNITILLQAQIQASTLKGALPLSVQFAGSAVGGTPPYSFSWNLGDGSPSASAEATSHTFDRAGTYTITLTVTDTAGHEVTSQVQVHAGENAPGGFLGLPGEAGYVLVGGATAAVVAPVLVTARWARGGGPARTIRTRIRNPPRGRRYPRESPAPGRERSRGGSRLRASRGLERPYWRLEPPGRSRLSPRTPNIGTARLCRSLTVPGIGGATLHRFVCATADPPRGRPVVGKGSPYFRSADESSFSNASRLVSQPRQVRTRTEGSVNPSWRSVSLVPLATGSRR
jgi:PKD repeat protein